MSTQTPVAGLRLGDGLGDFMAFTTDADYYQPVHSNQPEDRVGRSRRENSGAGNGRGGSGAIADGAGSTGTGSH